MILAPASLESLRVSISFEGSPSSLRTVYFTATVGVGRDAVFKEVVCELEYIGEGGDAKTFPVLLKGNE